MSPDKRVAVKKEGASTEELLPAAWAKRWGLAEDGDDGVISEDDEEGVLQPDTTPTAPAARTITFWARDTMGHCPAVSHLIQSCRGVVGGDNGLVPICVLYQACTLCVSTWPALGPALPSSTSGTSSTAPRPFATQPRRLLLLQGPYVGLPESSSCVSELRRLGAEICTSSRHEPECRSKVKAVARLYSSKGSKASTERDTCAQQPCLAYFFLTAPAVAFTR